jgi:hypothetical protein
VVDLDEQTSLGFSAAELMQRVGGARQSQIVWRTSSGMYATHARAGNTTDLNLTFDDPQATAVFVDSQGGGCPPYGEAPCIVCESRLEIDVPLAVTTADGALDESMTIRIETTSLEYPGFSADLEGEAIAGAYFDEITPEPGYEPAGLHIEAYFSQGFSGSQASVPDVWNGFVAGYVRRTDQPTSTGVMVAHGYFPPETAGSSP